MTFHTSSPGITIRWARQADAGAILTLVRELAEYEKMLDQVVLTAEIIAGWLESGRMEALVGEFESQVTGMALFYTNISTFAGKTGLYLEDLYVTPAMRGRGLGKDLLRALAAVALERGCGRLEWWCLDWNKPSLDFYRSIGALAQPDRVLHCLAEDAMRDLVEGGK